MAFPFPARVFRGKQPRLDVFDKPRSLAHGTGHLRHTLAIIPVIADLCPPPLAAAFAGSHNHILTVALRTHLFIRIVHHTPPDLKNWKQIGQHDRPMVLRTAYKKYGTGSEGCQGDGEN